MFQNRKFGFYTVILCLAGFVYALLCACIGGGLLPDGWPAAEVRTPETAAALLAVPLSYVCLEGCRRYGVRQSMIVWGAAAALGCVGLANASGLYWLFSVSLVLVRCACLALWLGMALLCCQWSIRCRGRVLGLAAMGGPVFFAAAAGSSLFRPGADVRPFYLAGAVLLALMAPAVRFLLRDAPEDAGLYPDGEGFAPDEEDGAEPLPFGQLLRDGRFWLVLAVTGALILTAAGCLGTVQARLMAKAGGGAALLQHTAPWLVRGAVLAIPACLLFGWLCDKLGELWSSLPLLLAGLGAAYLLWTFPKDVDPWTGVPLCVAAACLLGGVPVAVPALIARAFGRQRLLSVCRALVPALALLGALPCLLGGGERARLYVVLMAAAAVGLVCLPLLGRVLQKKRD